MSVYDKGVYKERISHLPDREIEELGVYKKSPRNLCSESQITESNYRLNYFS